METEMKEPIAGREKYWSELTDTEKIERMRQIIRALRQDIGFLQSRLGSLEDHAHIGDKIYTRREGYGFASEERRLWTPKDDEIFF